MTFSVLSGGKKKPLKAPKAKGKDMDDVSFVQYTLQKLALSLDFFDI